MKFIAQVTGFNNYHSRMPIRAFRYADEAREWIDDLHRLMSEDCDAGKSDDYVESALLHRIAKDGSCVLIDNFDGLDRGDGLAAGWENECQWQGEKVNTAGAHYGCSHSQVKGDKLCRYHRRFPQYVAPRSVEFKYKSPTHQERALRADQKDEEHHSPFRSLLKLIA